MSHRALAKSATVVSTATLFSRILGFARDIIIATLFGTALPAQAFVVAFRIPNLLRDLVGEGATNAAFVPVLSEYLVKRTRQEYWELARVIFNLLIIILAVITILGIIFAPLIVKVIAPGFISDPLKLQLTINLTRIMFPYIMLIGLTAFAIGVLNSFKSFALPALGPAMLNISLILCIVLLYRKLGVISLAVGVLVGGIAQLSLQLPALYHKGLRLKGKIRLFHPAAKKIARLLLPRALGSCVYQINVFVDTILASLAFIVGEGAVPALYYANRIIQFPLGLFGIAMATAVLPTMSAQAASRDIAQLRRTVSFSLRSVFLITVPAAIGIMVLARPIVQILFERGQFGRYSTDITSYALFFYAIGLFAYGGIKILVSSFYSLQDTATPVKVASFSLVINVVLNLILMWKLKIGGLALATALSATVNFAVLFLLLRKKIGDLEEKRIISSFLRILCAAIVMGISCLLLYKASRGLIESQLIYNRLFGLLIPISGGILVYIISALLLKVEEMRTLLKWILKR